MPPHVPLGLSLNGGMLQNLPADSSPSDMAAFLNQIIDKLNEWDGVIVATGIADVTISSAPQSLTTIPHGLPFTPHIEAELNNVSIALTGSSTLSMSLPTFLSVNITTTVNFLIYMFAMADATNLYFYSFNSTGAAQGTWPVTYYLKRLNANLNA